MKNTWECELIKKPNDYVYLFNVKKHKQLKNKILKNINNTPSTTYYENVSKSDWQIDSSIPRPYWDKNIQNIFENCSTILKKDVAKNLLLKVQLHNYWFHTYKKNSHFDWHTHGNSHFSGIYYINLPERKYKTEFLDINVPVKEGNLLIFPGFLPHSSPVNKSIKQKIVLSFNFCIINDQPAI